MFGKKDQLIGLDIGSQAIKVAEVTEKKARRILKKFGMVKLPQGTIVEGRVKEPQVVADMIKGLIKDLKVREQNVATSIAGYSVIIKKITVDKMTDEELQDSIQYEAEQYIPFDVADVNIDFHIIGENESNPNQMNVMLVAAKKEIIDEYKDLIAMADLNPCVIDVDVFALEKAFGEVGSSSDMEEGKSVALIDIGANKLVVNILKDNVSAFTRDVAIGGEEATHELASRLECSFEEAEDIKVGKASAKDVQEISQEVLSSFISKWSSEIRQVIDFYYSTYPDETIGRIILSGGATQTAGFLEYLVGETSIEAELFDPFRTLEISEKVHDIGNLRRIGPQAAICMGLAFRRMEEE